MTTREKIQRAINDTELYPPNSATIEYNFDEDIDTDLFQGVKAVENKRMERNSAKVIYRLM